MATYFSPGIWLLALTVLIQQSGALLQFRQALFVQDAPNKFLNGRYQPKPDMVENNEQCYEKDDASYLFLCQNPSTGRWVFWLRMPNKEPQGYMVSTERYCKDPMLAGPWLAWENGKWSESEAWVEPDSMAIAYTITSMVTGSLCVVGLICWLALSSIPDIRELLYDFLSRVFTICVGYLGAYSTFHFFCDSKVKNMPANNPVVRICVALTLFTSCFFLMSYIMWKFQFSYLRVSAIRTLMSSITSFFGIALVTNVQAEVSAAFPGQLDGSGIDDSTAEILGAAVVVVLSMMFTFVLREASIGLRAERFSSEPEAPWYPKKFLAVAAGSGSPSRMCTSPFATKQDDSEEKVATTNMNSWQDQVEWAEDMMSVVMESYLLNQVITLALTGHLAHVISDKGRVQPGTPLAKWGITLFALVVLAVVACRLVSRMVAKPTRFSRSLEFSFAMAPCWCMYRFAHVGASMVYPDCQALANALSAFAVTVICVLIVRVVARRQWVDDTHRAVGMFGTGLALGLICGISWGSVFLDSIETFGEVIGVEQTKAAFRLGLLKWVLSLVLAIGISVVWFKVILPRSDLGKAGTQKWIDAEEASMLVVE